ncbi:hydroxypyruvate isomerase family protein [Paenibacillus sp. GCM10027626]|uniref:hydroxypyruvate isomerase family protein n=1 Tax=Paenibacillus sp. GCM10027626 TaxID=3273411 RepID=UPI0036389C94
MKISVCIDAVLRGYDLDKSLQTVKSLGIDSFEFWAWWNKDIDRLVQLKQDLHLEVVTFCTKFISLVDSSKKEEYLSGLQESIVAAKRLDCKRLITQVGDELTDLPRNQQRENLIDGLKACVPFLEQSGMTLLVEPLNINVDHKGYFLYRSDEAFEIIDEVGSNHVKVLFDIYHQQITEGNLINTIIRNIDKIGHFHAAGHPGRHELGNGEINYKAIFNAIRKVGFNGYIGLEYFPLTDPKDGIEESNTY